jgi:hypothetical protein
MSAHWTPLRPHVAAAAQAPGWSCAHATTASASRVPRFGDPPSRSPPATDHNLRRPTMGRGVTRALGPGKHLSFSHFDPATRVPRLHYAFSARTVCGRDPCLHAVPGPPTGTPRPLSPRGRRSSPPQARPGDPTARKRGVSPLSIDPTTADVMAIHRLAASGLRGRTAISPPAAGLGLPGGDPRRHRRDGHGPQPEERSRRPRTRAPKEEARSE